MFFSCSPSSYEKIYEEASSYIILNNGVCYNTQMCVGSFKTMHSQPMSSPNQIVLIVESRLVIKFWRSSTISFINVLPMSVLRCGRLTTNHLNYMSIVMFFWTFYNHPTPSIQHSIGRHDLSCRTKCYVSFSLALLLCCHPIMSSKKQCILSIMNTIRKGNLHNMKGWSHQPILTPSVGISDHCLGRTGG